MMRKLILTAVAAASALAVAAPAAAQWGPVAPVPYGNAYGYNNYGYNNWGHIRSLQARIDQLQRRIARLDNRDRISEREARRLREATRELEYRLRVASRNGLHPVEAQRIEYRLVRLEQRLVRDAWDGRRWGQSQWGNGYYDRDRDGLDDRFERDRGRNYDEDRDPD
ncbi:hypothetical protein H9L13_09760 [Sphingomonas lutea]|uniref:Periplasmic heavy metal sensor n=1 Tax=Sphingomonas lutea TaxID=1045317 RepID=A0A7G9SGF5_9SPHN|nr:hypothetical protein [Sphingomonas lutea]QNN66930.1 hypothetical protein H9L13_09760 [Sphingomonas lutea]